MTAINYSQSEIQGIIESVALQNGVNPNLALATAQTEDPSLNPAAINSNGEYSVGIYQENMQGGEGSGYSVSQLENPVLNAEISLSHIAAVQATMPGASPGQIAAAAQRPANPTAYAAEVNANYQKDVAASASAAGLTNAAPASYTITGVSSSSSSSSSSSYATPNGTPIGTTGQLLATLDHFLNPRPSELKFLSILPVVSTTLIETVIARLIVGSVGGLIIIGSVYIFISGGKGVNQFTSLVNTQTGRKNAGLRRERFEYQKTRSAAKMAAGAALLA